MSSIHVSGRNSGELVCVCVCVCLCVCVCVYNYSLSLLLNISADMPGAVYLCAIHMCRTRGTDTHQSLKIRIKKIEKKKQVYISESIGIGST